MTAPARFTQSDISRAMKGARQAGFASLRIEIDPNGKIVILTGSENRKQDGAGWEDLE